jgi:hypothetical protein
MKKVIHVESNDNAPPGFPLVALITLAAMVSVSSKEITKGLAGLANEDHPRSHQMPMTWMVRTSSSPYMLGDTIDVGANKPKVTAPLNAFTTSWR